MTGALSTTETDVAPAARLAGLAPYAPPPPAAAGDLRLDANEGPPPAETLRAALGALGSDALRRYPDASALEARLAARWGVAAERVVVTNGGDDAIDRLCRAVLEPGRALLAHAPTFEMIGRSARLAGATVRTVPWNDAPFPVDAFTAALAPGVGLAALVTPNNPTGGVVDLDDVRTVARAARAVGAAVLLDLAYVEFADVDPTCDVLDEPNVVVVRTFSKARGLAGLRVGCAIAPPRMARWLRTVGGPYPVSGPSLAVATAVLDDEAATAAFADRVRAERTALTAFLGDRGFPCFASQANFITVRVPDAPAVAARLADRCVRVRSFPGRPGLVDCLRITLPGAAADFTRLTDALAAALPRSETAP